MAKVVLICDDEPEIRRILMHLLSPHYTVVEAACGEEALALISGRRPDLVVLDMVMPGLDGLGTMKAYRELDPTLPTLVLTGADEPETAIRALSLGAHAYITKPFEPAVLIDEVRSILEASAPDAGSEERPPWRVKL